MQITDPYPFSQVLIYISKTWPAWVLWRGEGEEEMDGAVRVGFLAWVSRWTGGMGEGLACIK